MLERKRCLPEGWYPSGNARASESIAALIARARSSGLIPAMRQASAVVAPHASWQFSGELAAAALSALQESADTVVVFGGHLSSRSIPLVAVEESFQTPQGPIRADSELRKALCERIELGIDEDPDNTVEIQLPLVKHILPGARVLWLRLPASTDAYRIGAEAAAAARELGRTAVAIGSTDLTHYGPNYGFMPRGGGTEALDWVKCINDRRFIEALLAADPEKALSRALDEGSACSPGAALGALGFAEESGANTARLIGYSTSADVRPSSSFVGYAAISWEKR